MKTMTLNILQQKIILRYWLVIVGYSDKTLSVAFEDLHRKRFFM
jgi:hypothetical protein